MQIGHSIWARASAKWQPLAAEKLGQASTNKLSSEAHCAPWNCYTVLRLSGLLIRRSWVRVPAPGSVGFHMRRLRSQAGNQFCPHHWEHDFVDKTLCLVVSKRGARLNR